MHLKSLKELLSAMEKRGMVVKAVKGQWMLTVVTYLGFRLSTRTINLTQDRVKAILEMTYPNNAREMRSFCFARAFFTSTSAACPRPSKPICKCSSTAVPDT